MGELFQPKKALERSGDKLKVFETVESVTKRIISLKTNSRGFLQFCEICAFLALEKCNVQRIAQDMDQRISTLFQS